MRKYWIRIGLGAAGVFAVGMFLVTLGRNVHGAVRQKLTGTGSLSVPLALVPFEVDGRRVGSVRQVNVQRSAGRSVKHINLTVRLKGADFRHFAEFSECGFVLDGGRGSMFDCVPLAELEGMDLTRIGEVRFEPAGVTRPILVQSAEAREWFQETGAGEVTIEADANGTSIDADADNGSAVRIRASDAGASIRVRDADGREVVRLEAGANGVDLKVKGDGRGQ